MSSKSRCCGAGIVATLRLGSQPVGNRFLKDPRAKERLFGLTAGVCGRCGTVQLINPAPFQQIVPKFDWINYIEPEGHLDEMVERVIELLELQPDAHVVGLTEKDGSTLRRFEKRGIRQSTIIDPLSDLHIKNKRAQLETIQQRVAPPLFQAIAKERGAADLVVVRHVIEHVHDIKSFLSGIAALLKPGGYALFECPDSVRGFETRNYPMLWEEHIFYFTPATLASILEMNGFEVVWARNFSYEVEDSLVAVVRQKSSGPRALSKSVVAKEIARAKAYFKGFPAKRREIQKDLRAIRKNGKKIAIFGAGHSTCLFINLNRLGRDITMVVDDNPHKQGLYMPGSRVPIRAPSALQSGGPYHCLFGLGSESLKKVKAAGYASAGFRY